MVEGGIYYSIANSFCNDELNIERILKIELLCHITEMDL